MRLISKLAILAVTQIASMAVAYHAHSSVSFSAAQKVLSKLQKVNGTSYKLLYDKDENANAYASKQGVVINQGMLNFLDNKDQLALILAHELGHMAVGDQNKPEWVRTYQSEYNADQYGANLAVMAGYNRCRGVQWFKKSMRLWGDDTSRDHPMDSLRYGRISYGCR